MKMATWQNWGQAMLFMAAAAMALLDTSGREAATAANWYRQAAGYRTGHATNGCADRAAKGTCCGTRSGATQGSTDPGSDGMGTRFIGQRVTVGIVEIRHRSSPVG